MADLNISCGDVILSLGTSDTAIYCSSSFSPLERGHVFIHPTNTHQFVYLIWSASPSFLQLLPIPLQLQEWISHSRKNSSKMQSLMGYRIRCPQNDSRREQWKYRWISILFFFYSIVSGMYFDMDEIEPRVKAGDYKWNEKGERVEVK